LLAAFFAACIYALWQWGMLQLDKRRFTSSREMITGNINPLDDHFENQQINIDVFANPFHERVKNKSFNKCKIYGPGVFVFLGDHMSYCGFKNCDTILIKNDVPVHNAIIFEDSQFKNCDFYNLTIFVPEPMKEKMGVIPGLVWLSSTGEEEYEESF